MLEMAQSSSPLGCAAYSFASDYRRLAALKYDIRAVARGISNEIYVSLRA